MAVSMLPTIEHMQKVAASASTVVVADVESTGFADRYDDLIELGAVKLDVPNKKVLHTFSSYCKLKVRAKVPDKIVTLTGITDEDLEDAPNIETALEAFRVFIGGYPLVFHNAVFDWRMISKKFEIVGIKPENELICSMKLFQSLHPGIPANLESVTTFYGTPIVGHHRAYVDARWTAAAYCKMNEEIVTRYPHLKTDSELFIRHGSNSFTMEELEENCSLFQVNGWKKGRKRRIYCTTNIADVFYDLNDQVWNISKNKADKPVQAITLGQFVLKTLNTNLLGFQTKYAPV